MFESGGLEGDAVLAFGLIQKISHKALDERIKSKS